MDVERDPSMFIFQKSYINHPQITDIPSGHSLQSHLDNDKHTHRDTMSRFSYNMFRLIQDIHNFTIFTYRSTSWGIMMRTVQTDAGNNATTTAVVWNGAIGFLTRGEVDVCITPVRLSPERFGHFEPTTYLYHVNIQFLFRHPKASLAGTNIFLQPFRPAVWLVTLAVAILSTVMIHRMLMADDKHREQQPHAEEIMDTSWTGSVLMIVGILFQQGYETLTRLLATRIAALAMLFLALMLFQFYGAFIVGSLLMQAPKTIRSIGQLLASQLECGIDSVVYLQDIFNHLVDPTELQLYRQKVLAKQHLQSWSDGFEAVKRGGFAFAFSDISPIYSALRAHAADDAAMICELQEIQVSKPYPCSPAVANGSPWQELIKIEYARMYLI